MFRFEKRKDVRFKRTYPKHLCLAVDSFDKQDFNHNDAGWIRNTISELSRCTSKSQYDTVMSRLVELAGKGDVNPEMTLDEQFGMIKPRYAQSSIEIANYLEMTNSIVSGRIQQAYEKSVKQKESVVKKETSTVQTTSATPNE